MKKDYTHISILLDRSGSMDGIKNAIIGGFNEFIQKQKNEPGKLTVTLTTFADAGDYKILYNMADVQNIEPLTDKNYRADGMTALNDSFVKLIKETGDSLSALNENDRPEKVLLVSLTDGNENNSEEYPGPEGAKRLKEIIQHQKDKYSWEFLYIGANQDSFSEGVQTRGYSKAVNFSADTIGTQAMYKGMGETLTIFRSTGNLEVKENENENQQ